MTAIAHEAQESAGAASRSEQDDCVIRASGVRKKYCRDLRRSLWYSFLEVVEGLRLRTSNPEILREHEFWAIDDVSFELRRGDSLGLLGRNGAGKSTLLKLLTGQRSLTAGTVVTRGRIVALTELGLGFDPVLTGRENAYVNAAVYGVSRGAFDQLIEEIIDFSELREFIDSAVHTYSTGMKARLGFAVATHLNPDLLVVDEVLAVGDLDFRRKCVLHVQAYLRGGGSVMLVAHDPYLVQSICNRAIILERGRMVFEGSAVEGVDVHFRLGHMNQYAAVIPDEADHAPAADVPESGRVENVEDDVPVVREYARGDFPESRSLVIDHLEVVPTHGQDLQTGKPARVILRYRSRIQARVVWAFTVQTADLQVTIASCSRGMDGEDSGVMPGEHALVCLLPALLLRPGVYAIRGGIGDAGSQVGLATRGYEDSPCYFTVAGKKASRANNWQQLQNDLVEMEVEWL